MESNEAYPFVNGENSDPVPCNYEANKSVFSGKVTGGNIVTPNNPNAIHKALETSPLSIAIAGGSIYF